MSRKSDPIRLPRFWEIRPAGSDFQKHLSWTAIPDLIRIPEFRSFRYFQLRCSWSLTARQLYRIAWKTLMKSYSSSRVGIGQLNVYVYICSRTGYQNSKLPNFLRWYFGEFVKKKKSHSLPKKFVKRKRVKIYRFPNEKKIRQMTVRQNKPKKKDVVVN